MNFSFNTPLTKVIGSPMIGTQLRNNIADPYCIYKFWARSNLLSEIGNHFLFFKSSSFIPNHQFRQEPRTFPTVATRMSKTIEYSFKLLFTGIPLDFHWKLNFYNSNLLYFAANKIA